MSVTYGFYNSINGDRKYNAEQLTSLIDGIINDGVFMGIGDALLVNASTGMTVIVGTGRAWFNSTWTHNDTYLPLTVSNAEVLYNRIDVVVLEVNHTEESRANTIKIIKGAPGTVPVAPTLTRTELVNQYALAHIYVGANVTEIVAANITNKVGTGDCPFVTGILQTLNLTALLAQWDGEFHDILDLRDTQFGSFISSSQGTFNTMMTDNQGEFNTMMSTNQNTFDNSMDAKNTQFNAWFQLIQAALDENIATNLLNMINTHKDNNVVHVPHLGTTTNTGNAYEITSVINIPDNAKFSVKFNAAATGNSTLKISSDGIARDLMKPSGYFKPKAAIYSFIRDGVNFQLLGEGGEYGTVTQSDVLLNVPFGTEDGIKLGTIPSKSAQTYTPSQSTQTIASGQYLSGTQTISPVSFDAAKVLNDTTIAGKQGTMPDQGTKIITPSTVNQAIAGGYHDGSGYVKGDANLKEEYILKDKTIFNKTGTLEPDPIGVFQAGYNSIYSDTSEASRFLSTAGKMKEAQVYRGGTIRVAFDLRGYTTESLGYARIYVNNVAVGTTRFASSYATFTEDITIARNDLVQIYGWGQNACYVKNFTIRILQTPPIYVTKKL